MAQYTRGQVKGIGTPDGTADQGGMVMLPYANVRTVTGTDTATTDDGIILANSTSAAFTETLPSAASYTGIFTLVKTDSSTNQVTIAPSGSDTINGASTYTSGLNAQYGKVQLASDGVSKWYVV